jgi:lipoprotein signal peptidase
MIQLIGWIAVLGTVVVLIHAIRVWKQPDRWLWSRISETLIAAACLGAIYFMFTWNMLHWSLRY